MNLDGSLKTSQEALIMDKYKVEFRGSWVFSLIPLVVFLASCFMLFVVYRVFDMEALAVSAFVGLLIGAAFSKTYSAYWDAVMHGIGSPTSVCIVVILLVIGIFSKLMAISGVSQGFVWLADMISMHGGAFTAFTFVACALIASATGSSIGTLFTAFPILYPAGILLGSHPGVLAGAILSGAIFGDNLAPISDVTIASASNQTFSKKSGIADIAGVVSYRLKYALIAGSISTVFFLIFGGGGTINGNAQELLQKSINPAGLMMLLPVGILLMVSIRTRDIFKAVSAGIVSGILVGILAGVFTPADIFSVKDGAVSGFVYAGFKGMIGISIFCISLFGILGVLNESGTMNRIILALSRSKLSKTLRGTEIIIAVGTIITTALMGGVTSASVLTFGPVANEMGSRHLIHPYRRANLLSGFANSLPAIIPFISAFIFITLLVISPLRTEYAYIPEITAIDVSLGSFYPMVLFVVLSFSVLSGWDVKFEGRDGALVNDSQEKMSNTI